MKLQNILMGVFPLMWLFVIVWRAKVSARGDFNEEFFSSRQSKNIQAIACLGIIMHHIVQEITSYGEVNRGPITIFANIGLFFTALFFFSSGYGLMVSLRKKQGYLDTFLLHRIPTVLFPFFTANLVYVLVKALRTGARLSVSQFLKFFFGINLINSNGWFIIEILILYVAFFVLFKVVKKSDLALILLSLFTIVLIYWSKSRGHDMDLLQPNSSWFRGEWWYNSTIVFVFGLWYARFETNINRWVRKRYRQVMVISTLLLIVVYEVEELIRKNYGYYNESVRIDGISSSSITLMAQMIACLVCTFWVLLVNQKVTFENPIIGFVASISLELFLIHKLFMEVVFEGIQVGPMAIFPIVYIPSILASFLMGFINRWILKAWKREVEYLFGRDNALITEAEKSFKAKWAEAIAKNKVLSAIKVKGLVIIILSIFAVSFVVTLIMSSTAYKEELENIAASSVGDEVFFGKYELNGYIGKEKMPWIVVDVEEGTYTLVAKYGIEAGPFNRNHEEVNWESCSLNEKINEEQFKAMFSQKEAEYLVKDEMGSSLSLMTVEEAKKYFTDDASRKLLPSAAAVAKGVNVNSRSKMNGWDYKENKTSWWWLRNSSDETSVYAPTVSVDGEIFTESEFVNRPDGAIRPLIRVKVE